VVFAGGDSISDTLADSLRGIDEQYPGAGSN